MRINVPNEGKYLVGVSGGCDSMALLSLCVQQELDVVAAFVNYRLRESSGLEEQLVREYCSSHNIPMETLYPVQQEKENFQKWARDVRYEFYRQAYEKHGCKALLLGHHRDDSVENYLMALQRKSRGMLYGIAEESYHHGMRIIRPLLNYRKKELRKWCDDNGIPYHDDESNFSDRYQRNRIRHAMVEKADDSQIEAWVREINGLNADIKALQQHFDMEYGNSDALDLERFRKEEKKEELLRWFLYGHDSDLNYSEKQMVNTVRALCTSEKGSRDLGSGNLLVWEYELIYVMKKSEPYSFLLKHIEFIDTPFFRLTENGTTIEGVTVTEKDFPITIRPYVLGDSIELRYGHKKVNRFMIDHKILKKDRVNWPVIVNSSGNVIFVPGIGCDICHYSANPNVFMLK